jgi:hypothetical protein
MIPPKSPLHEEASLHIAEGNCHRNQFKNDGKRSNSAAGTIRLTKIAAMAQDAANILS